MSLDQSNKFRKFKIADGRHFENGFSLYLTRESSDLDEIWRADVQFYSENCHVTPRWVKLCPSHFI